VKGLATNLGLTAGVLIILVIVCEVAVRLLVPPVGGFNTNPIPETLITRPNFSGVPFVLKPNGVGVHEFGTDPRGYFDDGATLTYRLNSMGFRGPDVARTKPPGAYRIVGVGDSFAFGTGVRADDTFLAVLERELNTADAGGFEVINLGVPGYDTDNEVNMILARGVALAPDLVIICFFLNDAGGGNIFQALNQEDTASGPRSWVRKSRLVGWRKVRHAFGNAKGYGSNFGFDVVVVIFPILWQLSDYPFADIHTRVGDFVRTLGLPVLDLYPEFATYDGPELWVHPYNQHPNEEAHAIAGRALGEFLVEGPLADAER
jgi:lysophospholipase L1-like esterase